jgi:hypothetical protein
VEYLQQDGLGCSAFSVEYLQKQEGLGCLAFSVEYLPEQVGDVVQHPQWYIYKNKMGKVVEHS